MASRHQWTDADADVDAWTSVSRITGSAAESPTAVVTTDIKFAAAGDICARDHRNVFNRRKRSTRYQVA